MGYAVAILIGAFALVSSASAGDVCGLVSARKGHHAKVTHAREAAKTCWRYYARPEGRAVARPVLAAGLLPARFHRFFRAAIGSSSVTEAMPALACLASWKLLSLSRQPARHGAKRQIEVHRCAGERLEAMMTIEARGRLVLGVHHHGEGYDFGPQGPLDGIDQECGA